MLAKTKGGASIGFKRPIAAVQLEGKADLRERRFAAAHEEHVPQMLAGMKRR
jgi:hypothetical protein